MPIEWDVALVPKAGSRSLLCCSDDHWRLGHDQDVVSVPVSCPFADGFQAVQRAQNKVLPEVYAQVVKCNAIGWDEEAAIFSGLNLLHDEPEAVVPDMQRDFSKSSHEFRAVEILGVGLELHPDNILLSILPVRPIRQVQSRRSAPIAPLR